MASFPVSERSSCLRGLRSGWTIVELLVVIGILAILTAITLPAVMVVRERARFADCQNNMRQVGLAMQGHEGAHGNFVEQVGTDCRARNFKSSGPLAEWLPWLDRRDLYDAIPTCGFGPRLHSSEVDSIVPVFLCPSDALGSGTNVRLNSGSTCDFTPWESSQWGLKPYNGVFCGYGIVKASDITDGLSYTVGASEKLRAISKEPFDPRMHSWDVGVAMDGVALFRVCANPPDRPRQYWNWGGTNWWTNYPQNLYYNHVAPPNWPGSDCEAHIGNFGIWRATSQHWGGVNTLRMDGSVHFATDSVDLELWHSLATRAGDETVAGL